MIKENGYDTGKPTSAQSIQCAHRRGGGLSGHAGVLLAALRAVPRRQGHALQLLRLAGRGGGGADAAGLCRGGTVRILPGRAVPCGGGPGGGAGAAGGADRHGGHVRAAAGRNVPLVGGVLLRGGHAPAGGQAGRAADDPAALPRHGL